VPNIDSLGMPPVLKEVIMEKRGLILMVGATGTSMTTLAEISDPEEVRSLTAELASGSSPSIAESFKQVLKSREEDYVSDQYEVDEESVVSSEQEPEFQETRKELDALTDKMNWLRNRNNSG